jgi:hypothetical protein
MIFRTKNGELVNIVRSKFTTDCDYYLQILRICHNVDISIYNNIYKKQKENIESIEKIINITKN